jgi:hypothetical protein
VKAPGHVVELCGLPGAGKTHVAQLLAREMVSRGVIAHVGGVLVGPDVPTPSRVSRKLGLTAAEIAIRPRSAAAVALRIAVSGQRDRDDVARRVVQWLGTQRLIRAARRTEGVHILDEGVVQALWSVGLRGDVSGVLRTLESRRDWAAPDLVVLVEARLETIYARLDARPSRHSRVQRLSGQDRSAEIAHGERLLARIVDWWTHTHGAARLLRLTADGAHTHDAAVAAAAGLS